MESFFVLADQVSRTSLHSVANSALPNAPVLPYVEPRRRMRRLIAGIRHPVRHPSIDIRAARYSHEC
jgi:hypothetical protein